MLAAQDAQPTQPPPAPKPADPDLTFARHAYGVRQAVALWEKITSNAFARRPQSWPEPADYLPDLEASDPATPAEPAISESDRSTLYEAVAKLALIHPSHAEIPATLNHTIAETLAAHPQDHVSVNFARICQAFHIPPDRTRLQPHLESQLRPPPDHIPQLE